MKSKKTILLILIIVASIIPEARALTPQSQTVKITDTHDDMFITEVGIGIDSSLVTIKDPEMDIRSFLVFRELEVNYWEPLENATLRLHTSNTLTFDADSSITVYGIALSDLQLEGWLLPSTVLSLGFTEAHTNYNTSEFYGQQWHEIDVTDIVEELIRNPNWDGDGSAGTETGDAIGFHILGPDGDEKRYFYDLLAGNSLEAQLILHWNHEPPPPTGTGGNPIFNSTYRGYDIWNRNDSDWIVWNEFSGPNAGSLSLINETYTLVSALLENENTRQSKAFSETGWIRRVFTLNVTSYQDSHGAIDSAVWLVWGLAEMDTYHKDVPSINMDSYHIYVDGPVNGNTWRLIFTAQKGTSSSGGGAYLWNATFRSAPDEYTTEILLNLGTGEYMYYIWEDMEMTDLWLSDEAGQLTDYPDETMNFEFVNSALFEDSSSSDRASGFVRSFNNSESWIIVDENGTTVIKDLEDYESALEWIEDILGADPEDPNPPGEGWDETGPYTRFRTRLYILLMGFGLIFGPLFYFAIRRPSGYEFVIGLFIMFVGYAFLRAAAGI